MTHNSPIAIVGIGGVFPGAPDTRTFWENIYQVKDVVSDIPADRWVVPPEAVYSPKAEVDKTYSLRAGVVDFEFDPHGLAVDGDFLNALDPLYHYTLAAAREAFADCDLAGIDRQRAGVILAAIALPTVGSATLNNLLMARSVQRKLFGSRAKVGDIKLDAATLFSSYVTSRPASLLAQAFGMGGGSYTLDAACATSLYAIKRACDELQAHRADVMVAGGVSRPEILYTQVGFTQLRALSKSGCCRPFDAEADGLVVGEGAGILILKRLNDALAVNDKIYGVIRGIGLSNDIGGNLLAPESEGQVRALRAVYDQAGWSPRDVDIIECHGTGTPVGDAVELASMRNLWDGLAWSAGECPIGSIKSMIGHLLTGAGAASMIKVLLGMENETLPPSANFSAPGKNSPLIDSPFYVLAEPRPWEQRNSDVPRRAGVSSFGFGGINAHVLVEQWMSRNATGKEMTPSVTTSTVETPGPEIAVIGMDAVFGNKIGLHRFQEAILRGDVLFEKKKNQRWRDHDDLAEDADIVDIDKGAFIDAVTMLIGEFNIPPNEINDILCQHLLALKTCARAMTDAGLPLQEKRPEMGVVVGMDFDVEANNYHFRWNLFNQAAQWNDHYGVKAAEDALKNWTDALKDVCSPPLIASRVLGALGGIMASRIAKQFRFGGPSYVVSCDAASGLKALETGVRSLQRYETNAFLVGAVDLPGDVRRMIIDNSRRPYSRSGAARPFDNQADGPLPGEGAVALVLKRLDDAMADGNRVYAVIKGIGSANANICPEAPGAGKDYGASLKTAYQTALQRAFDESRLSPETVSFVETNGSGCPEEDRVEAAVLARFFKPVASDASPETIKQCALGSVKANIGHTGAAAGLASFAKTCLCLYQQIYPKLVNYTAPALEVFDGSGFHMPAFSHYWLNNRSKGLRTACTAAIAGDGNCLQVVAQEFEYADDMPAQLLAQVEKERKKPLGLRPGVPGLFIIEGDTKADLIARLEELDAFLAQQSRTDTNIERIARRWYLTRGVDFSRDQAVSIVTGSVAELTRFIEEAKILVTENRPSSISGLRGIRYSTRTSSVGAQNGQVAFVFPGSGNHYLSMGRKIGVEFPEVMRILEKGAENLKELFLPDYFFPQRHSWAPGWEEDAKAIIAADPLTMIIGQVTYGELMACMIEQFGVHPDAVIGYSLGESAGLFATGAWKRRQIMLDRMAVSDLFTTQLAGPCEAARRVWQVPPEEPINWRAAVVNRSPEEVRKVIGDIADVHLLIVNTPHECVLGGRGVQVEKALEALHCDALFLEGVITVHCDAAEPVKDAYRELHLFPVFPPEGVRYYSSHQAKAYALTSDNAAQSIVDQALYGFDFPKTIEQAYEDGVRVFLEMGPQGSCTRMIQDILGDDKPYLAVSACNRPEKSSLTVLKFLSSLVAERVPVDLDFLYGEASCPFGLEEAAEYADQDARRLVAVPTGGTWDLPAPPQAAASALSPTPEIPKALPTKRPQSPATPPPPEPMASMPPPVSTAMPGVPEQVVTDSAWGKLMADITKSAQDTANAHQSFLAFSASLNDTYAQMFALQTQLLEAALKSGDTAAIQNIAASLPSPETIPETGPTVATAPTVPMSTVTHQPAASPASASMPSPPSVKPAFDRDMCMEFATGSIEKMLGPMFAPVDTYPVRVRLPDEPLMLVDRIVSVKGEMGSLTSGEVVTEHDVYPDAWYLDGGRVPVCIAIEAGQADLFLCSYLGIDLAVKGTRSYRLLDAVATFHEGLPRPGDVIRYVIKISRFIRQGATYLFFFEFKGYIGQRHIITMENGCAGFFTQQEVKDSGGIVLTRAELAPRHGKIDGWRELAPVGKESYSDAQLDALRSGDLGASFGPAFDGLTLPESLRLPGGRMRLVHRVTSLDPTGGRYGLGNIQAEADIHPDDWFLTCHFVDDMVMPGTLMYQCCEHVLRVLLLRMGWVTDRTDVCFEPVPNIGAVLKCRGPVTPETPKVIYEVELSGIGYNPEPYVTADAFIYAEGERIVMFENMSLKVTGLTQAELETFWANRAGHSAVPAEAPTLSQPRVKETLYDRDKLLAYAIGSPSEAFGEPYTIFDKDRIIARLPGPPYFFMDRVTYIEPEPWVVKPGGWIEAEYSYNPDEWYFRANRQPSMPFCILLEIALQPCGWLAAYVGSALRSKTDVKFRNLGGKAIQFMDLLNVPQTLTMRSRMTKVSESGGMLIQHFDIEVLSDTVDQMVYQGTTYFGFFSQQALARQVGVPGAADRAWAIPADASVKIQDLVLDTCRPLTPDETVVDPAPNAALPSKALLMIDRVDCYLPDGGAKGLGFIRGTKTVDPDEWFFKAHFYQDPVMPGSLGLEAFILLLKLVCLERWPHLAETHRFEFVTGHEHEWIYRGQVVPKNKQMEVDAEIIRVEEFPYPAIYADGFLKADGIFIYEMKDFGLRMIPVA